MNLKLFLVLGAVAAGWTGSAGAQALEYAGSRPLELTQNQENGENMGRGAADEGVRIGPSGQTTHGMPRTNGMDTLGEGSSPRNMRMPQQGIDRGMQSDPGRLPGPGSAGSTLSGGPNSLGPTSGGSSTGMGPSGGASGMGGSAGMGASGRASGGLGR
jgi:hypothetical protein